jgi:hypothetical protein
MPGGQEKVRSARERETLVFATPEEATAWREKLERRREEPGQEGQRRTVVTKALEEEFARAGEDVRVVREPWEHTPEEHREVQELIDVAFAQDLPAAIRLARRSPHYPRNLDLLHDTLTGEMYELVQQHKLEKQPLWLWAVVVGVAVGLSLVVIVWLG